MSTYKRSAASMTRHLGELDGHNRATKRLVLDLADILTGPTSGGNAVRLAESAARYPRDLAEALRAAGDRYLRATSTKRRTATDHARRRPAAKKRARRPARRR